MSVVANVLCSQASWIAYDGRASRNGLIISESTEKALMINDLVCVGYTGTLELAQVVIQNLKEHVIGIKAMRSDTVSKAIELILSKLSLPENTSASFLVTGLNCNGMMASYTLGTAHEMRGNMPTDGGLTCSVLGSEANHLALEPFVIRHIRTSGFSNLSISDALCDYIRTVAKVDKSVNPYCRVLEIRK